MHAFIVRHSVPCYFATTFAISWGGILLVVGGPAGFTGTAALDDPRFPAVYLAMLSGPVFSGLLFTWLVDGRPGLHDFGARLLKWRVAPRHYLVALLTAPLSVLLAAFGLSVFSNVFTPAVISADAKLPLLLTGLGVGLGAGIFEELGWTGFATVHVRRKYGLLTSGLLVGVLWGGWHVLAVVWGLGDSAGYLPLASFLAGDLLSVLPVYRILMVWTYEQTSSLLLSMLMHASLTATLLIGGPSNLQGVNLITFNVVIAVLMWLCVTWLLRTGRNRK